MQGRILIVDDDRDFVDALRTLLSGSGYEVLVAYDGRDGLRQARRERPDLIMVDVMMDERTEGFFAVQQLRRATETASTPIFLISAVYERLPEFGVPPDPRWTGHDAFIAKPVDPEALLRQVREALAGKVPQPAKGAKP
jgi:CheY-like chemotaxis protein